MTELINKNFAIKITEAYRDQKLNRKGFAIQNLRNNQIFEHLRIFEKSQSKAGKTHNKYLKVISFSKEIKNYLTVTNW